jgi:PAS domain S-box-containing protein
VQSTNQPINPMLPKTNPRFFSRILLPSLLAVLLFMAAIYLFVIPNYRESLMDGKRETIRELTNTAWSVMHKLDLMVNEDFKVSQAQKEAIVIIADMRYGDELKDYFWITDTTPRMVMHPYRPSMIGMDLTDYRDPRGKNFFVDIVNIVEANGDGYVDYKWQWKDDSLTVVPKLSYVKAFKPWGWIVGTGIYIEDVNREISNLTRRVVWISVFITLIITTLIVYLARRNYVAEAERQRAQERLRDSMQRYKKLVEASTDGVLMMIENEIVYCNPYLLNLLGYAQDEFDKHHSQLFETLNSFVKHDAKEITVEGGAKHPEISSEQKVRMNNGVFVDVIVNRSKFDLEGKQGLIYAVKDVSKHKDVERELDLSMEKLKSIAGLMNLGIFRCTLGRQSRFIEINPKALELLGYNAEHELKDTQVQELFDVTEEKKEVIRAINEGTIVKDRLLKLKRADGTILPALVSLFPVHNAHGKTVFCDGIIIDAYDHLCRDAQFDRNSSTLQLSANILLHPINDYVLPAPQCDMDTPVVVASKLMTSAKADIILVMSDKSTVVGLLTHSDISRRIVALGGSPTVPVSEVMSAPVISVSDDDMVMDAFNMMVQHKISYVVVKSKENLKPSYISLIRLSELRKDTPEFLVNSIQNAGSIYEITDSMNRLPQLIQNLVETGTGVATTGKLISRISDAVTEKLIKDALDELGKPPAPFAFMALGSEGRREQTLATDQDNAIVYRAESPEHDAEIKAFFLKLGSKVCNSLNRVGYPLCKGGVMAMNREWCMEFEDWKKNIFSWINTPNPQEILNISIFFDFRPVYGEFELANTLQQFCLKTLKDKNVFFFNLAKNIIDLKIQAIDSSNLPNSSFDIKLPILAIISIARLWALKFGISERNTPARLFALQSAGVMSATQREEFDQAFRYLMLLRIKNQLRQFSGNEEVSNEINSKHLADIDRIMLKRIVSTISDHQNRLGMEFRMG